MIGRFKQSDWQKNQLFAAYDGSNEVAVLGCVLNLFVVTTMFSLRRVPPTPIYTSLHNACIAPGRSYPKFLITLSAIFSLVKTLKNK